jgi:hypothetical protein
MRTCAFLFIIFLSSITFGQMLNDSLILYFPFNGNALDSGKYHLNGDCHATFIADHLGHDNSAVHFNGFDQYIDLPLVPEVKPNLPVSFAFWIRFEDPSPFVTQIFTTDFSQDTHTGAFVSTTLEGALQVSYGDGEPGCAPYSRRSLNCSTILKSDMWYYIIAIIRGPIDISVYLNCTQENGVYEGYGGDISYTNYPGSLGRKDASAVNPPDYFHGALDDFRYWHIALNSDQVDSLCAMLDTGRNISGLEPSLYLFPNPADNEINIANLPAYIVKLELFELTGKLIRSLPATDRVNISEFCPGAYFIRFINKDGDPYTQKKFVICR